ncbi:MAG: SDR family oxidoreductase [Lachnospiraceae bacterium]|nr:SDR family oxidoreductase [Lachnospiraceae bacterium]
MLDGKNVLITGAGRGFGRYLTGVLAGSGARVAICSRNEEELKETVKQAGPDKVFYITADMGRKEDIDRLYDLVLDRFKTLDVVVNNAGIQGPVGRFDDNDWDEWQNVFNINLFGTAYSMKKAIGIFKEQHSRGKIINMSGGGATSSRPNFSGYAAAKTAVVRLSEVAADENREFGIDINSIAPGVMNTDMLKCIIDAGMERSGEREYGIAASQKEGDTGSLIKPARLIEFLASDASNGISGKLISAVWDDWDKDGFGDKCGDKDIYTLRRTVE